MAASTPKTADKYVPDPKGVPHNKQHAKNYTPAVPAPKCK